MICKDHKSVRDEQSYNHNPNNKGRKTCNSPKNINPRFKNGEEFAGAIHFPDSKDSGCPELHKS